MIQCIIDGKVGYPDTKNKIKVTYENQYVNDSGSYTYQVSFPMSILVNKALFGNVDRFDVKKTIHDFEDCRILVDNRLVISGKGTVMAITNDSVKLQIIGGKSRIKYNSKFTNHFIDEIDYPDSLVNASREEFFYWHSKFGYNGVIEADLSNKHVVGEEGKFAFNPVYDETNDIIANAPFVLPYLEEDPSNPSIYITKYHLFMFDLAVQPYLMYVLKLVLQHEGFTLRRNDFDVDPWNRLVICNARKSTDIKMALPHWSVYTFIEEVRKLFNASFIFDEVSKTVDLISTDELTRNAAVNYDCMDEFSVEFDDEGLKNLATSNVEYEFADSENRDYRDVIPLSVMKKFPLKEYPGIEELVDDAEKMTQKERMTTIFKIPDDYVIFVMEENEQGNEVETISHGGFFNPLVRNENSEDYEQLKIVPVAMTYMGRFQVDDNYWFKKKDIQDRSLKIVIPSMTNDKESDMGSLTYDEDKEEYYISVQDAMEDTDVIQEKEEQDDEKLQVMFQSSCCYNYRNNIIEFPERDGAGENAEFRYPQVFTDYRMYRWFISMRETASLSLNSLPCGKTIGDYANKVRIDSHNVYCIKFPTDEIPDPGNIFIFRNKKFICQKIEIEINEYGIERVKTGYFYEIFG